MFELRMVVCARRPATNPFEKANRGNSADVIICDEFGFMSAPFFIKAVAPLFLVAHTALLCITTPSDNPNSQYSELLKVKDELGNPPFWHYEYAFVCSKCMGNKYDTSGKDLDGDARLARMLKCPHKDHRLPPWHSPEKHAIIRAVMEHSSPQDMLREQLGVITTGNTSVFSKYSVDDVMRQPTVGMPDWDVPFVYMCIDPNTGSHDTRATPGSDFALVSGYDIPNGGGFVITGMEAIDAHKPDDYLGAVIAHAQRLRMHRCTHGATLVVIAENNLGMEAGWLKREMDRHGIRRVVYMQDKDLKTGVHTDHHVKQQMMVLMRELLMRPSLLFSSQFVCLGKLAGSAAKDSPPGDPANVQRVKNMLAEQLRAYSEIKIPAHRPEDPVRVKWTGKTSHGMHDDLCVAAQLLLYWKNVFHQNPEYKAFWTR